jgi:hypothetical protein
MPPVSAVEEFLATRTFKCVYLRGRLTPAQCAVRQAQRLQKDGEPEYGWRAGGRARTLDGAYCKSGKCEQGIAVVAKLGRR